ncbi:DUF6415 family natural product biosynthesis protein [Streptomyces sp. NPDC054844]
MAALTPAVDKDEVLPLVEAVLSWDLRDQDMPAVETALALIEQFTISGRAIADELRDRCLSIPVDSAAGVSAQAALGEATRRLYLPPPSATPLAAAQRAQNLGRLLQRLFEVTDEVSTECASLRPEVNRPSPHVGRANTVRAVLTPGPVDV